MKMKKKPLVITLIVSLIVCAGCALAFKGQLITSDTGIKALRLCIQLSAMAAGISACYLAFMRFKTSRVIAVLAVITVVLLSFSIYKDGGNILGTFRALCGGMGVSLMVLIVGPIFNSKLLKKDKQYARMADIYEKDERIKAVRMHAKDKTFNVMAVLFGAITMGMSLFKVDIVLMILMAAADICVIVTYGFYNKKFDKEM